METTLQPDHTQFGFYWKHNHLITVVVEALSVFILSVNREIRQNLAKWPKLMVICRLETYIGNKLDWKHKKRLETFVLDWKQKKYIGNNLFRLETLFLDWKQ